MTIYKQITLNVIVVYCKLGFFKSMVQVACMYYV